MDDKFDVDADLVRKLAELLAETGLGEIEYEDAGKRVRVAMPGAAPAAIAAPGAAVPSAAPLSDGATPASDAANHPGAVTSPMVGTIYRSPAPGEPPFVRPGDTVTEGQTILMVEAMKTFNEIAAPRAGKLSRIVVEDGQPVEFGEVLALIE